MEIYWYNKRRSGSKHKGYGKDSEEEWSENIREAVKQGIANMSEESIQNIREAVKQGIANMSDKQWSENIREAVREAVKGDKNPRTKKIICLETQQVFTTIKEAQEWFGGSSSNIVQCCKGKRKSCGKHPITGEKLHWMYYEDYLEKQNKENTNNN